MDRPLFSCISAACRGTETPMKNPVEILAPAGSMDALTAAVRCGANAVYLGAGSFNARRNAANFSPEELEQAVAYCHLRGVKVYLTTNTLVSDSELDDLLDLIHLACSVGIDACIIQDLAVARLIHETAPEIRMHGSTQLATMTPEGFQELEKLGFVRAVLPRELTLPEIRKIRRHTGLELEIFVHGALCMSVSGQCYLSAMLGGRSGNRGLCAQPCRLPFTAPHSSDHALSLKDLDLIDHIPELSEAGVLSYKIEGRMKRPEYVAAAVTACRNKVDGIDDPELTQNLRAVFSRSGFTDGYLTGHRGPDMFGTRRKDDVTAAAPILQSLSQLYAKETSPTPMDITFTARRDAPPKLTVTAMGQTASAESDKPPQAAQKKAADRSSVLRHLEKTGGTAFFVRDAQVDLDDGLFLPASELNALRREAVDHLSTQIVDSFRKPFFGDSAFNTLTQPPHQPAEKPELVVRFQDVQQYSPACKPYRIIVPLRTPEEALSGLRADNVTFGVEIPRAQYQHSERTIGMLKTAKQNGAAFAAAGTLDGVALAKAAGLPIMGLFTLNAFNSPALEEYRKLGVKEIVVSQELRVSEINALRGTIPRGFTAYGRTPLMLTRNSPVHKGDRYLTDRKDMRFPVIPANGASELLNSRPIYMADRLREVRGADFALLYFTVESRAETEEIIHQFETETPPTGGFTRGLYYRGVR